MTKARRHQNTLEVSVEAAVKILGVSDRMVLNYVKARKLKGIKVGKRWFLDQTSVEAFRQDNGLRGADSAVSETSEISESAEPALPKPEKQREARSKPPRSGAGKNLRALACYRLCLEAFTMSMWSGGDKAPFAGRLLELQGAILEYLGSGYYSYGVEKRSYYDRARGLIGSALALVYSDSDALVRLASDVAFLEGEVLPAFASLIRKMEQSQQRYDGGRRNER